MAGDQGDGDADIRWLSYAEIAKIRGISRASAERIVRRAKWRRQADNQGITRAAVPLAYAEPERTNPPGANSLQGAIDALREQQDHERTAWREDRTRLVADLDHERARADTAEGRAGRAEDRAAELRERLDAAELARRQADEAAELAKQQATHAHQVAAELRQAADARKAGVDATETTRQAEAMVDNLREAHAGEVSALKTERHRLATQIDGFAARADQAEARTDSLRARVDVLQRERDTARAAAQEAADGLRQAEEERRARGLLARLRAAWRGR